MLRLDRLETQIRQLTGVIEQLQFRNQQLEGQVRRLQEDTDYRFQESSAKGGARPALQSRPQTRRRTIGSGHDGRARPARRCV